MSRRRHASVALALALVSAACSGSTGGGGAAAPAPSTTTSARSLHDAPPAGIPGALGNVAPVLPLPGGAGSDTTTTTRGGAAGTSTTVASGSRPTTTTATATATTVPPALPPEKCPEPKTCRRYRFGDGVARRWRAGADGVVRIPYRINPSGSTTLAPEQIEGAIRAAFDTWQRAAPAIRFVYEGRTTLQAAPRDGVNVIAFNGPTIEHTVPSGDKEGFITEFDMLYTPNGWTWTPCEQRDGSCTPHTVRDATGGYRGELQSIATHAAGHALWLGDTDDDHELGRYLTMYPNHTLHPPGSRFWSTLALGDVLGVRALYPCSCPLPPIYDP